MHIFLTESAVALGGIGQLRILGDAVGVSIATNLLNNTVKSRITDKLPADVLSSILKDITTVKGLTQADQSIVLAAFKDGFTKQLIMILAFCAAEIIALMMTWEWPIRRLT